MANTNYNRYASVADATPAVALATPAFAMLPWASGTNIQLMSTTAPSPTMMPNGASAGIFNTAYWVEGTFSGQLGRDVSIDNAFQSLLMNAYASKVLIPGSIDKPVCYEKTFTDAGVSFYRQARGCQHSKLDIKWDAEAIVDFSTDFTGLSDSRVTTMITGATYAQPSATKKLTGADVTVTIGALGTTQLKKGSISVSVDRKPQTVCGPSLYAVGVGTSGSRKVEYSFSFYKRDFTFESALLNNAVMSVAVNFGAANTGYKFESANVIFETPDDEDDDSGQLITVKGTAAYDTTALADLKITQL
jgi:hypothetical protein